MTDSTHKGRAGGCQSRRDKAGLHSWKGVNQRWEVKAVASKGNAESSKVRAAQSRKRTIDLRPVIDAIRAEGAISLRQIAAALNEKKIPTARGGEWSAVQVRRLLARH